MRKIPFLFLEEKESTMMQESASRNGLGADKEKWREKQGFRGQIPVFKKGRRVGKRLFAFFLAMLLAAGQLETVSFAEEVSASPLQVKETESENQKEAISFEKASAKETASTESTSLEESSPESSPIESSPIESATIESSVTGSSPVEASSYEASSTEAITMESSSKEGDSSVTDSLEGTKKAAKFILNSEETEIEGLSEAGVLITAKYPESTFPLEVQMEVRDIKEESLLEEMKEKALQRAKLQDAGNHLKEDRKKAGKNKEKQKEEGWEIDSLSAVDISFYVLNEDGKKVEVQPKKGKAVEITLEESSLEKKEGRETTTEVEPEAEDEAREESDSSLGVDSSQAGETKLQVLHFDEQKGVEYLDSKEEEEGIRFQGKRFSPYAVVRTRRRRDVPTEGNNNKIKFHAFWSVNATANKDASISYINPDYSATDEDTKKVHAD